MYHSLYYKAPIRHLFRGSTNAIKSMVETVLGTEITHLSTPNKEPGRVTGATNVGLPPLLPGAAKTVATTTVTLLQEDGPDVGLVAAVEPVDREEEEAEEEDIDNRNNIIMQYFM
ncbi:hypothetical protein NDU88_000969 [Pleurodeles waltl]|uniref:Uncharacterized protein n=1 Tax=Pleurodeles waltl TaxID=8319 RepID=A0AAV7TIS2_PLEWA|nr:hypothetical protein NDU88_000969 [Pleurodeles waltl]